MPTNKLLVVYRNAEDKTGEALYFNSIEELKTHIQKETLEFLGDDNFEAEDMNVLNEDNVYYEESFQMHHSWTVFDVVIKST